MTDFLLMVCGALFVMVISGIVNYKKAQWVDLTDDEKETLNYQAEGNTWTAVELAAAKLKGKNT